MSSSPTFVFMICYTLGTRQSKDKDKSMFNEYLDKAMHHANYEQIEDGTYFGRIPGFKGVWANKPTEQECCEELRDVLEGWVLLNIADHTPLPVAGGAHL